MSIFDNIVVEYGGALAIGSSADYRARSCLEWCHITLLRRGAQKRAEYWADSWFYELQCAHYWAMYALALEENS